MTEAERTAAWIMAEFDRVAPFLQGALDRDLGTHDLEDVRDLLLSAPVQLWTTANAAMVTVVETYPRKKMLRGWLSGGKLEEIVAYEPKIRDWAKRQGCDLIVIGGRKGWLRAFEGYQEASTVIAREI